MATRYNQACLWMAVIYCAWAAAGCRQPAEPTATESPASATQQSSSANPNSNPTSELPSKNSQAANDSTSAPSSSAATTTDPDRRAAEWVLRSGGHLVIVDGQEPRPVNTLEELPAAGAAAPALKVIRIDFEVNEKPVNNRTPVCWRGWWNSASCG